MSRVAKVPIKLPQGTDVRVEGRRVTVKGKGGAMSLDLPAGADLNVGNGEVRAVATGRVRNPAIAGTVRASVANLVRGVNEGFVRKLELVGVGYRAQVQGNKVNLSLGFSHPVVYVIPDGVRVEAPTVTEILVKGADKQMVGQVAAEIRAFRPPEPYKGKGVRHAGEKIIRKEAKKK